MRVTLGDQRVCVTNKKKRVKELLNNNKKEILKIEFSYTKL